MYQSCQPQGLAAVPSDGHSLAAGRSISLHDVRIKLANLILPIPIDFKYWGIHSLIKRMVVIVDLIVKEDFC